MFSKHSFVIAESITLIDSNEASNSSITSAEKDKFLEDKSGDKVEQEPVPMDDDDLVSIICNYKILTSVDIELSMHFIDISLL